MALALYTAYESTITTAPLQYIALTLPTAPPGASSVLTLPSQPPVVQGPDTATAALQGAVPLCSYHSSPGLCSTSHCHHSLPGQGSALVLPPQPPVGPECTHTVTTVPPPPPGCSVPLHCPPQPPLGQALSSHCYHSLLWCAVPSNCSHSPLRQAVLSHCYHNPPGHKILTQPP